MSTTPPASSDTPTPAESFPAWLRWLLPKLQSLRFGSVHLVVHEGRVTQVELTERTRLG